MYIIIVCACVISGFVNREYGVRVRTVYFVVQAIEENVVQMFYNVYSSDPQNADSLLKVTWSHDSHVIEVIVFINNFVVTGVEDLGNTTVFR